MGVKQQQVQSFLEKKLKKRTDYAAGETIELALEALQQALGVDLKAEEVDVMVVTQQRPQVTKLDNETVDAALNSIAERD
jgi:20S proteasome alpha/beta subunit